MPFSRIFQRDARAEQAQGLYLAVVAQGRREAFFAVWGVPDTLDGRFETITLHAFLVLRRLKGEGKEAAGLPQGLFDAMFADMDRSLREMGVGDLGVGRRVKAMAQGFYGRIAAYEKSMADGEAALGEALRRNLYGTVKPPPAPSSEALAGICAYIRASAAALASQPTAEIAAGKPIFAPLPPTG